MKYNFSLLGELNIFLQMFILIYKNVIILVNQLLILKYYYSINMIKQITTHI
jgi:hypothetical protein